MLPPVAQGEVAERHDHGTSLELQTMKTNTIIVTSLDLGDGCEVQLRL